VKSKGHKVCFNSGVSELDSTISLLVASFDLKLVQLIRDAIRTTDLSPGGAGREFTPEPEILPRRHIEPTPEIEPRRHFHPTPVYEARPVIHPQGRVEPAPPIIYPQTEPERLCKSLSPLPPPWKTLPWENPPQPLLKVKLIKSKPDTVRKGSLVDCFM
jgi:hypothetical protein